MQFYCKTTKNKTKQKQSPGSGLVWGSVELQQYNIFLGLINIEDNNSNTTTINHNTYILIFFTSLGGDHFFEMLQLIYHYALKQQRLQ